MNEAQQPDEEQPKAQPPIPLVHSLGYGAGTFLAAGMVEQVRENLPSPASPPPQQAARQTRNAPALRRGGKRTLLDRALGRFPAEEEDTILLKEPEAIPPEPTRQTRQLFTAIAHPILLSPELVLEADEIVGAGINIFGVKGSGKTGAAGGTVCPLPRQRGAL
jgi:hypothetical protein